MKNSITGKVTVNYCLDHHGGGHRTRDDYMRQLQLHLATRREFYNMVFKSARVMCDADDVISMVPDMCKVTGTLNRCRSHFIDYLCR